ncbi:MAG: hypothetical protein V4805_16810 [Pseudomonadota bacterium]
MMQTSEIQKRFSQIEQSIEQMVDACQTDPTVPMDLKDCVDKMDQQTDMAKQALQSNDPSRIRQCVDELEQLGDLAKQACQTTSNVEPALKNAVMNAHDELSDLKHELH